MHINKDGAAVAKTQGKENIACLKGAGKGTVADAQACLTADAKGKVAKAKNKTSSDQTKSCGDGTDDRLHQRGHHQHRRAAG